MWRFLSLLPLVAAYCPAGNTVSGDSNLGRVELMGVRNQNIVDDTNCPGGIGLTNRTYLKASLLPGGSYTLNFQATTCDTGWSRYAYAFIDFNNNDVFDENELIGGLQVDNRLEPVDVSFSFRVPPLDFGSVVGVTRMRVFVVESGFAANPCLTFTYGGVKEFSIEIIGSRYCDAGNTVAGGSNLGQVNMVGESHTAISDNSNCPGRTGIRDLSDLSVSVTPGGSYSLTFDVTTCNGRGFPRFAYAFIDFNKNEIYDSNELVGTLSVGNSASPIPVTLRVTVPCNAVPGSTRMRVFVVEGGHETDPCLIFAYGGVKEFSIVTLDKPCLPSGTDTSIQLIA